MLLLNRYLILDLVELSPNPRVLVVAVRMQLSQSL
jgi:hypothetical protein